jgi:hypothetical protein
MRPDAERFMRPDWRRYVKPGYELDQRGVLVESKANCERKRTPEREVPTQGRDVWSREDAVRRARWHMAALCLQMFMLRFEAIRRKANFDPNQPRVPAGSPGGGRWIDDGVGADTATEFSASRRRSIAATYPGSTPAQQLRLELAETRANLALRRVHERDPYWQRTPSLVSGTNIEGAILRAEAWAAEAEARLVDLNRLEIGPTTFRPNVEGRPMEEIVAPGGQRVGYVVPGARADVRTVWPGEFVNIRNQLMYGAWPIATPRNFNGLWFERSDGTQFGLRWSVKHGPTIEIIRSDSPLIRRGLKVHQK